MKRRMLLLLALILLLSLCACGKRLPEAAPALEETAARPSAEPTRQPSPTSAPTAAPSAAPTPIADLEDRPANRDAAPENVWVEIDYERDGVPFDPSAPARDGHTHDWVLDNTRTYQGTCCDPGPYTMVCSICGREYVSRTYYGEHEYQWENILLNSYDGGGVHAYSCIHCGDIRSMGNHQWTRADTTSNKMVCSVCGAVWYRQLPHGN
jgi:predicted small lipoprotein YifL